MSKKRQIKEIDMPEDKIVQVSGFGVDFVINSQVDYMVVGLTESGKVVITTGDGYWADISPKGKCVDCAYEIGKYGICNSCICYSKFEPKSIKRQRGVRND